MTMDWFKRRLPVWITAAAITVGGTDSAVGQAAASNPSPPSDLFVDPANYDFSQNPELLARVVATPHGYFRFINVPFGRAICTRYADLLRGAPRLNLHGDAHIEQYAVTDLGRGLTDFDDSSTGPGLLDLVRFGVSLNLTCREKGWEDQRDEVFGRFLAGYRQTLSEPADEALVPGIVPRIRSEFKTNRPDYFRWVESIMVPLPDETVSRLKAAFEKDYIPQMLLAPGLTADFFTIQSLGALHLGIGSALDSKFLLRVRGESTESDDDVVLELKEVRDLTGIPCVRAEAGDAFRILISQARIAYNPFRYLGYLGFDGKTYWAHSWVDNYKEIKIATTMQSPEELAEVAHDVGAQLGLGHPEGIASPLDLQLRNAQILFIDDHGDDLAQICRDLAEEITTVWRSFRAAVASGQ